MAAACGEEDEESIRGLSLANSRVNYVIARNYSNRLYAALPHISSTPTLARSFTENCCSVCFHTLSSYVMNVI